MQPLFFFLHCVINFPLLITLTSTKFQWKTTRLGPRVGKKELEKERGKGDWGSWVKQRGARKEREVFTGYFGLAVYSEALMQKQQICFLSSGPVAVMKQHWAPENHYPPSLHWSRALDCLNFNSRLIELVGEVVSQGRKASTVMRGHPFLLNECLSDSQQIILSKKIYAYIYMHIHKHYIDIPDIKIPYYYRHEANHDAGISS